MQYIVSSRVICSYNPSVGKLIINAGFLLLYPRLSLMQLQKLIQISLKLRHIEAEPFVKI